MIFSSGARAKPNELSHNSVELRDDSNRKTIKMRPINHQLSDDRLSEGESPAQSKASMLPPQDLTVKTIHQPHPIINPVVTGFDMKIQIFHTPLNVINIHPK